MRASMNMRNISSRLGFVWVTLIIVVTTPWSLNGSPSSLKDNWPQWRGPNRNGVSTETGLLKDWPAEGPRLLWVAEDLGEGYATVAVVQDRLYTAGQKADASYVLAL